MPQNYQSPLFFTKIACQLRPLKECMACKNVSLTKRFGGRSRTDLAKNIYVPNKRSGLNQGR